jgi:hypothetical protein
MKQPFLRRVLTLALCACLAVTLVTVFSPVKSAHAATTRAASCPNNDMPLGTTWYPGWATYWSTCNGTSLKLIYQGDGNFVLYIGGKAQWATGTNSQFYNFDYVQFQGDGNLVVYHSNPLDGSVTPAWASNTRGEGATTLALQADGNLVIYNSSKRALWASNTCCYS